MSDALSKMADGIFNATKDFVARALAPVLDRMKALEDAVSALPREALIGPQGPTGLQGERGVDGMFGEKGLDGKDGADAVVDYEMLKAFILENMPAPINGKDGKDGEDGGPGSDGAPGAVGPPGERGERGERGETGEPGAVGKDGANGINGKDGATGIDGRDGPPGRDAFELDILPAIDEQRAYARGTWARHAGGLWLARSQQPGLASWQCVVEGVAEVAIDQGEDLRTFGLAMQLSGGQEFIKSFTLPVVIYRGVFQRDKGYARGDEVTWGNQQFIALKDTKEEPLSIGGTDWQLGAKKGRDGKDGKDGVQGAKGDEGPRGRDLTHLGPNGEKYA